MKKKSLFLTLKLFISASLITFLLYKIDLGEFFIALKAIDVFWFINGLLVGILSVFIRAYKWRLLLLPHGKNFSTFYISAVSFISLFFNNFFLGSLGGDFYKIYITGKESDSKGGPASSVIMDRLTGVIMLALMASLSGIIIYFMGSSLISSDNITIITGACLVLILTIYISFKILFRVSNLSFMNKFPRVAEIVENIIISTKIYREHPKTILASLGLSFVYYIITSVTMYFYVLAAGQNLNFILLIFINLIVSFLTMIPVSVNGIGVQEGAFVFYLAKLGINPASSLLIALLPRIDMLIFSLIGAVIYLIKRERKSKLFTQKTAVNHESKK